MLAATVTVASGGKVLVPAINVHGGRVKLPAKKELGICVPVDKDVEVLAMSGRLTRDEFHKWMETLGDVETPLENEDEVHIESDDAAVKKLIRELLWAYRQVSTSDGGCPPLTKLDVQHHIDTGQAAPIMVKRHRQAQTEDTITEDNMVQMLQAGGIEEGNGAWGFLVVLVRKKDGEVRFCVDYRALNKVTKKDVYPLPHIDGTLEALGGAKLFTLSTYAWATGRLAWRQLTATKRRSRPSKACTESCECHSDP
jgi:hypothetical protein